MRDDRADLLHADESFPSIRMDVMEEEAARCVRLFDKVGKRWMARMQRCADANEVFRTESVDDVVCEHLHWKMILSARLAGIDVGGDMRLPEDPKQQLVCFGSLRNAEVLFWEKQELFNAILDEAAHWQGPTDTFLPAVSMFWSGVGSLMHYHDPGDVEISVDACCVVDFRFPEMQAPVGIEPGFGWAMFGHEVGHPDKIRVEVFHTEKDHPMSGLGYAASAFLQDVIIAEPQRPSLLMREAFKKAKTSVSVPRVVRLRREYRERYERQTGSSREVDWAGRWLVSGHYREQACGKDRSERKRIWIKPHIKGPEDKPMLRRRYLVNR